MIDSPFLDAARGLSGVCRIARVLENALPHHDRVARPHHGVQGNAAGEGLAVDDAREVDAALIAARG